MRRIELGGLLEDSRAGRSRRIRSIRSVWSLGGLPNWFVALDGLRPLNASESLLT